MDDAKKHRISHSLPGDVGLLDRIEATIEAAERCMNASPFWDENSRHAGKALLDYPRSQIAHERAALTPSALYGDARLRSVINRMGDAIDVADRLIERGYGIETPQEWHEEIHAVQQARAALSSHQGAE